ncbi:hypothetical protein BDV98DRAFT_574526 [Pterulicium gracile]|uniref:Uncharacterized protein n=1 Tax=Pterulicium gracile TaxID=1884261 RepID=A0A5C3QBB4_9AGAR|nr:hypothetical protein BDV98DRAFT_574526 [Pterula gracilis]
MCFDAYYHSFVVSRLPTPTRVSAPDQVYAYIQSRYGEGIPEEVGLLQPFPPDALPIPALNLSGPENELDIPSILAQLFSMTSVLFPVPLQPSSLARKLHARKGEPPMSKVSLEYGRQRAVWTVRQRQFMHKKHDALKRRNVELSFSIGSGEMLNEGLGAQVNCGNGALRPGHTAVIMNDQGSERGADTVMLEQSGETLTMEGMVTINKMGVRELRAAPREYPRRLYYP